MTPQDIERLAQLHRTWTAASRAARRQPQQSYRDARLLRTVEDAWHEAQDAARKAFAESRGWKAGGWFTVHQLRHGKNAQHWRDPRDPPLYPVIDHAEYYRCKRKPIAIVSHSYGSLEDARLFGEAHGLEVEELPSSWHYPGGCRAFVFTSALKAASKVSVDNEASAEADDLGDAESAGDKDTTEDKTATITCPRSEAERVRSALARRGVDAAAKNCGHDEVMFTAQLSNKRAADALIGELRAELGGGSGP